MKLYTIGYEQYQKAATMIGTVPTNVIFIDVRRNPFSYNNEFTMKNLADKLGNRYRSVTDLGNEELSLKDFRIDAVAEIAIKDLIKEMESGKVFCLLCKEKDHKNCHRNKIAETFKLRKWGAIEVIHLGEK